MQSSRTYDIDVLITGAGPVGLFLANECARRSLRYRIVEKNATQSEHSKAVAIMPRTLEIFDMAGLAASFVAASNHVTNVEVVTHQHSIAELPFTPQETPYPFVAMLPQDVTERLLVEALQRRGGRVDYQTNVVNAVDEGECVRVTLDHNGSRSEMTARYLAGCDGAHSTIRHLLSLPFEGGEYASTFMLADIDTNAAIPADRLQLCPHEDGPIAVFPMSATRRRVVATVDDMENLAQPSLEMTRRLLAQRGPSDLDVLGLNWSSFFHVHHRQVASMQVGRIFIAGDAAHIHSPFGAQGMNTGLQDVWNLCWKLDLAVRGDATGELLQSYTQERHHIAKQVISMTDTLTKAMSAPSTFAQTMRDAVIPVLSKLPPFRHEFVSRLSELGLTYKGSSLVVGHGDRYFADSLRGGSGIDHRFILFMRKDTDAPAAAEAQRCVESFSGLLELRESQARGMTLVRPDGYTAFTSAIGSAGAIDRVRTVLARQIRSRTPAV